MLTGNRPAKLLFGISGYRIVAPGEYVTCAVSGQNIALEDLRYWSADLQEAYASAAISTGRMREVTAQNRIPSSPKDGGPAENGDR